MSFGYKTEWIAVRERSLDDLVTALSLGDVEPMSWEEGTDRAYGQGVYVGGPVSGWVLAHGRHLILHGGHAEFTAQLAQLSAALGEVQFFGTHRGVDYAAWAWARDGRVLRAYCMGDGQMYQFHGEVTEIEHTLGVGTAPYPDEPDALDDEQWAAWWRTHPGEDHVMQVAGAWSINPLDIENVPHPGLYAPAPARSWVDPVAAR
ncbi:hypothetical protein AB0B31_20935 [Catellatospora citrea]|uniref:hypothetical protein n=1 Tax=Catellatospora citrea TaxID=53366 RepID=UPI0033D32464